MLPLHVLAVDRQSQILSHHTVLIDNFHTGCFEVITEIAQSIVGIEFGTVEKSTCPRKDGGYRVGRGFFALLPLTVVASDRSYV
jgi:hypothetical protein